MLVTHNPDDIDAADRRLDLDAVSHTGLNTVDGAGAPGTGRAPASREDGDAPATVTGPVLARGGAGS